MNTVLKGGLALLLVLTASACGVKNDLVTPDGKATPHNQTDPSKPSAPISQ